MEFRVLGSLETRQEGSWQAPTSARDRAVLAELLVHPGQVVSADHLIDALWGDALPVDPVNAVQVRISRLRKFVRRESLVTCPNGYMLADVELDTGHFTSLADRAAQASGEQVIALLDEALRLWRGRPFLNVPASMCVDSEARALEEARLLTEEQRAAAGISLGRHAEVIQRLVPLMSEYPLRERLRVHLMHALYLSGRQGEALDLYAEGHQVSVQELGLAPGPELRSLQQAILEGDPSLLIEPSSARVRMTVQAVPRQLPADVEDFTGREQQLEALARVLAGRTDHLPVVSVVGMGGMGKTSLAVHAAHHVRHLYPDGQLFADLQGSRPVPLTPTDVLTRFITALDPTGPAPAGTDDLPSRYRSLLADRRVLIVLDDVAEQNQIAGLLPGYAGCAVLLTSRRWSAAPDAARTIDLDGLDSEDARRLLTSILGVERVSGEPEAVQALLSVCAGVPLALRAAGARLASRPTWPVAALARRLAVRGRRLSELAAGRSAVTTTLSSSCELLDHVAARCLRSMATMDRTLSGPNELAFLVGASPHRVEEAMEGLVDAHLAESPTAGCYRLHPLVRLYAATLPQTETLVPSPVAQGQSSSSALRQSAVCVPTGV